MAQCLNVGLVGLGRMGMGITERLIAGGHRVTAFDLDPQACDAGRTVGAAIVNRLADLPSALAHSTAPGRPRIVWLVLPAGQTIDDVLLAGPEALAPRLSAGDVVIDGGNSNFRDSMRRAARLADEFGVRLIDCGTSAGVDGRQLGYCFMLGGDAEAVALCEPLFAAAAAPEGYAHMGPSGAGHFVKMVNNATEYGLAQVLGEGFSMLDAAEFPIDLGRAAELWQHGSIIRSWLMELAHTALSRPDHFERIAPKIGGGSTGTWAVEEAARMHVKVPAIALSLAERTGEPSNEFAARIIAALRYEFGRHPFQTRSK